MPKNPMGRAFWPFVSSRSVRKWRGIPRLRRVCANGFLGRANSWFLSPILAVFYYDLCVPQLATNVLSVHSVETGHDKKEVDGAHYWSSYGLQMLRPHMEATGGTHLL